MEQDPVQGVKWYRKAAEQGVAQAQYNLGYAYGVGMGVEENPVESMKWFRKAAEQGHEKAKEIVREFGEKP